MSTEQENCVVIDLKVKIKKKIEQENSVVIEERSEYSCEKEVFVIKHRKSLIEETIT